LTGKEDKERTNFMFSALPTDKTVNPKHWETKVSYWSEEILKSSRFFKDVYFSIETIKDIFQDDHKRSPSCLPAIVNELYQSRQIVFATDVNNILNDTSWSNWSYNILGKSVSWVWRKYWYGGFHEQTVFVIKELLEEFSSSLLEAHYQNIRYEKTDNVVPWNVIKNLYKIKGMNPTEENLVCVIGYLKSIGKCTVGINEEHEKVVKFKSKNQPKVDPVTINDFEIIKLKKTIAKLSIEAKQLEKEIQRIQENAQKFVKEKDKTQAKKLLIQKQKLQKTLTLKQDAVYSMKENLRTIQEAETTKLITDAFNSSASLLNQSYKVQGLTTDRIDEVFDKAQEAKEMVTEIEDALSAGISQLNDDNYDMSELEKELEELNSDQLIEESTKQIIDLPDVPTNSPIKQDTTMKSKQRNIRIEEALPA